MSATTSKGRKRPGNKTLRAGGLCEYRLGRWDGAAWARGTIDRITGRAAAMRYWVRTALGTVPFRGNEVRAVAAATLSAPKPEVWPPEVATYGGR